MHKHLRKITSYTESMLNSYKPITTVNQFAAQRIVISYIQVSRRSEVIKILTLENTVLWNVALYKCTEVSKECYASIFSLSDIHDSSVYLTSMMTAFFSLRLCSYTEIFQEIAEFYSQCVRFLLLLITRNI